MRYFAYGSNMLTRRMCDPTRAPSAVARGVARAPGLVVRFHKVGQDASGKCTLVAAVDAAAYGVLDDIADADVDRLDRVEGVHTGGYRRRSLRVRPVTGREIDVQSYVAGDGHVDPTLLPFDWYRDLVVAGAIEHGLPAGYVEALRNVAVAPDPDAARAAGARRLLDG